MESEIISCYHDASLSSLSCVFLSNFYVFILRRLRMMSNVLWISTRLSVCLSVYRIVANPDTCTRNTRLLYLKRLLACIHMRRSSSMKRNLAVDPLKFLVCPIDDLIFSDCLQCLSFLASVSFSRCVFSYLSVNSGRSSSMERTQTWPPSTFKIPRV